MADRFKVGPSGVNKGLSPLPRKCGHFNDFRLMLPGRSKFEHATELYGKASPSKWSKVYVPRDTLVEFVSCGGGGYGRPSQRDPKLVLQDVMAGLVSVKKAREVYGVVLSSKDTSVHLSKTLKKRKLLRLKKN